MGIVRILMLKPAWPTVVGQGDIWRQAYVSILAFHASLNPDCA